MFGTEKRTEIRVMSGMRPTGRLHIGHLVGALSQWVELSRTSVTFFEVADLHALTTGFTETAGIRTNTLEMVRDWLAADVDPSRATIYVQSRVPEISELYVLLAMITPVSWLQRVPTYKEQIEQLGGEIATYGFLGYPLLQTVDVAIMRANRVPVGRDQLAHLELGREIVRRFNHLYGETLVEAEATLSEFPAVPGTDGRKMSKSYGNTIDLADDDQTTTKKIRAMLTDPQKVRKNDPGRPEICPVFALHKLGNEPRVPWIEENCRSGALGCVQCKGELAENLNGSLAPIRERRARIRDDDVEQILDEGSKKARSVAAETLRAAKQAMKVG
jgi:tryptophanyl-tRNA synthetase